MTEQYGNTHCGAWVPVADAEEYGWAVTRLVCVHPRGHADGLHIDRTKTWEWLDDDRTPRRVGRG